MATLKEKFASLRQSPVWVYVNAFFITVASVLGTGILGLPVKLARCGFYPFLVSYTVGFFMQSLVLIFVVDLLQRTKLCMEGEQVQEEEDEASLLSTSETLRLGKADHKKKETNRIAPHANEGVTMHSLAKIFLDKYSLVFFDIAVIMHLLSICITYTLAGAQSYAITFNTSYIYIISPFVLVFTIVIIFGARFISGIISVLTFTKGSVLVLVVFVTSIVGNHVRHPISDDWAFIGRPFLIGTVALYGGAAYVLPVTFAKLPFTRSSMMHFIRAVIAAEFMVWLLNIIWAYYILRIVPQTGEGITLSGAEIEGQIATVPLVAIIKDKYSQYKWIAILINLFIMVSITVSYITMGTGLRHMLDGFSTIYTKLNLRWEAANRMWNDETKQPKLKKALYYSVGYLFIFVIAQSNPKSFLVVLEYITSLALNLASGVFVSVMIGNSLAPRFQQLDAPLQLPMFIYKLRYLVMLYFIFAVLYDLASIISSFVK